MAKWNSPVRLRRGTARAPVELDERRIGALRPEQRTRPVAPQHAHAKRPLVIRERAGEVGDLETYPSETRPLGEAIAARCFTVAAGCRGLRAPGVAENVVGRNAHVGHS